MSRTRLSTLFFVICKIPLSIPLKIETSMHQYFAKRYSVRCWYRCTALRVYCVFYSMRKLVCQWGWGLLIKCLIHITIFFQLIAQTAQAHPHFFLKNFGRGKPADIIFWPSKPPPANVNVSLPSHVGLGWPYINHKFTATDCIMIAIVTLMSPQLACY